jgi:hypothetical protein
VAFPGPVEWAAWIAVTVPAPLLCYEATHHWEEDQRVSTAFLWTLGALPVFAAVVAARSRSVRTGMLAATVGLAFSVAVYLWAIPLTGTIGPVQPLLGVPLAIAGAALGYLLGRNRPGHRWSARWGYPLGAAVAVAGALLAPLIVRLGAEDSTIRYDEGRYGGVGSFGGTGELRLPAGGRYAILAVGFAPRDPDCRVAGNGPAERRAELVTIPPADYGGDYATYAWVASFTVPAPGTYTLACRTSDADADYTVGELPRIRGAVGALIHWPLVLIWLLGSIPGLTILARPLWTRRRAE